MATSEIEPTINAKYTKKEVKSANCGLVMPISALDGCPAEHWAEVKSIITEAVETIENPKFTLKLVSDADDVGIIQKRIIQNVYKSDIVVCDVSGKNPNVMFELGMRLAFDKPVVIVKDDKTDYSFDTGIIDHITYPRDLRFTRIVDFKKLLTAKTIGTYEMSITKPGQSPFLKNFGEFTVANLDEKTVSPDRLLIELVEEVRNDVRRLQRRMDSPDLNLRRRTLSPEFSAQAADIVSKYLEKENITDIKSLIGNDKFYREMEQVLDAPRFFSSSRDFRDTIDRILIG